MDQKQEWVDFKSIKEAVGMQMLLDHYGINNLTKSGDELRGPCPVHKGSTRSKNFSVNLRKNAFKCFSADCGARGNILDFVSAIEHCSVRDAAIKIRDWFKIGERQAESRNAAESNDEQEEVQRGIYRNKDGAEFEVMTTALSAEDFERLVVYRELFGDYQVFVGSLNLFRGDEEDVEQRLFTLVKEF